MKKVWYGYKKSSQPVLCSFISRSIWRTHVAISSLEKTDMYKPQNGKPNSASTIGSGRPKTGVKA